MSALISQNKLHFLNHRNFSYACYIFFSLYTPAEGDCLPTFRNWERFPENPYLDLLLTDGKRTSLSILPFSFLVWEFSRPWRAVSELLEKVSVQHRIHSLTSISVQAPRAGELKSSAGLRLAHCTVLDSLPVTLTSHLAGKFTAIPVFIFLLWLY